MQKHCYRRKSLLWLSLLFILIVTSFTSILNAQVSPAELEAAYVERFTRFIEWPESDLKSERQAFVIGLIGDVSFEKELRKIHRNQNPTDYNVEIRSMARSDSIYDCDLLIIGEVEKNELKTILKATSRKPILTIAKQDGFAELGVLINLYYLDGNLKFEINENAFKASGLEANYLLIQYAKIVGHEGGAI